MIRVFSDPEAVAQGAAAAIVAAGREAIEARGRFTLALSGGETPRRTYEVIAGLTRTDVSFWRATHLYWSDERCVPPTDPHSNYGLAREALLDRVRVPRENVHRIEGEDTDPSSAALRYEKAYPAAADLVMLGMGGDGHTASLFPGSPALRESKKRFCPSIAVVAPTKRITITPVGLTSAREVLVIVVGADKSPVIARVFAEAGDVERTPARLVRNAEWFVDEAAARDVRKLGLLEIREG